jgi:hypothetical protein
MPHIATWTWNWVSTGMPSYPVHALVALVLNDHICKCNDAHVLLQGTYIYASSGASEFVLFQGRRNREPNHAWSWICNRRPPSTIAVTPTQRQPADSCTTDGGTWRTAIMDTEARPARPPAGFSIVSRLAGSMVACSSPRHRHVSTRAGRSAAVVAAALGALLVRASKRSTHADYPLLPIN